MDGGRVVSDILVERVEVVLGLLEPGDEAEGFGPILDLQGEHLQAHLAAMQGVAALVAQDGHHLPDGRQPFGLQRSLLGGPQFRDVVPDGEDAEGATRGVLERLARPFDGALAPGLRDDGTNETTALGPGHGLREDFSTAGPVALGHEARVPVLAPDFVPLVAGELLPIGIGADDPARGVEDHHDGLRRLDQALGEVAFLTQGLHRLLALGDVDARADELADVAVGLQDRHPARQICRHVPSWSRRRYSTS